MDPETAQLDHRGNKLPVDICPVCGYENDCATCADPSVGDSVRPKPGDLTLCLKCAKVSIFKDDMTQRPADLNDMMSLSDENREQIGKAQKILRAMRKDRR